MQDRELHLTPIKTFFQMRQTYSYFDKGDKRKKAEKNDDNMEQEEDVKQVTVKFAKTGDSEKIKKAREKSFQFISQIGVDEPWCEAFIYPKSSPQSEMERQKLPLVSTFDASSFNAITPSEYFKKLLDDDANALDASLQKALTIACSKATDGGESKILSIRAPISKRQVKKLPLVDQIKVILRDAKVLTFDEIFRMVSIPDLTPDKVLRNLTLCGVMIRGNWVLQSEVLYPDEYISLTGGVTAEKMRRGRDYVLFKLTRNEMMGLNRQKVSSVTQLPLNESREVLESVASLQANKTWDLLKPPDYDFESRNPDIFRRQDAIWKAQEEKFIEMEVEKHEKRKRTRSVRENK
jgi:DNA-directed RNA polymerase-3 subunit RPC5